MPAKSPRVFSEVSSHWAISMVFISAIIPLSGMITYRACTEAPSLEELQQEVGGYLQVIPRFDKFHGEHCVAFCDEEGSFKNMATNAIASKLWREQAGHSGSLRGTVVVLYGDDAFMEAI
mgnify:CR=1 FL=1